MRLPISVLLFLLTATSCTSLDQEPLPVVWNGIDVLAHTSFDSLHDQRVGLITNHTGRDRHGRPTSTVLHVAPQVDLRILFSPEHGLQGTAEGPVAHAIDEETGLPIHSLYTETRRPDQASLSELDTLVFDIQDVGCRFYTYISTMGEAMRAAAANRLRFVVLDRPNPINGVDVQGSVRDEGRPSFVAWHPIPIRHGMTVGELAKMFNEEARLGCELEVIAMRNWKREDFFDATGQEWVDPSPNIRSPLQALLYPGVGLLETTNLSVGRGTDTPFELLGAPWLNAQQLASTLRNARLPGVSAMAVRFTPQASRFKGQECRGVRFWITDRSLFDPILLGLHLAVFLRQNHESEWKRDSLDRLLVHAELKNLIEEGADVPTLLKRMDREIEAFLPRRQRFLLY